MDQLADPLAVRTKDQAPETSGGKVRAWLRETGAGLVTGAAADDPSSIATYAQSRVQFGYGQLWTTHWVTLLGMSGAAIAMLATVSQR